MKKSIYGRRQGTNDDYALLIESEGVIDSGKLQTDDSLKQQLEFEMRNLNRNVDILREKGVEGYVLLEGDQTRYTFSPSEKLTIPE